MVLVLDIVLGICFLLTVMDGARNGFFREIFSLAGLGVGLWAAIRFTGPIQQLLPDALSNARASGAVLFLLVCAAIMICFHLVGCAFAVMWEGRKPSPSSRIAGLVLGSARGLGLVLVLAAGLTLLFPPGSQFLGRSRLLPFLSPGIVWGTELLPRDLGDRILWRWGQLPFDDRLIIPGRDSGRGRFDRTADLHEGRRSELRDTVQGREETLPWPFAS